MDLRWSVEVKGGETLRSAPVLNGRRGVVTYVSLVHTPPSAVGGQRVVVEAYVKTIDGTLELASLSSERPHAELPRPVLVMGLDLFCSRVRRQGGDPADGDVAVAVRFEGRCFNDGYVLPPPSPLPLEDEEDHMLWSSEDDDDDNSGAEDDESVGSDSEDYDDDDSSGEEEEESDDEVDGQAGMESSADNDVLLQMVHPSKFVLEGGSAPRFAAAGKTAGFMQVTATERQYEADPMQILVLFRYTRFSPSSCGVEARRSTKEHQLRFIATGDHTARSLAWTGSSLGLLIYPHGFRKKLQELWSSLASKVSVPPGARRVEVFVDVGLLRRAEYTLASMRHMCAALEGMVAKPWPGRFTGMELYLPEPVRCGRDADERPTKQRKVDAAGQECCMDVGEQPAKRRRAVAAGEDCPVCWQLLEGDDLAAWPGCGKPHVFHGACLEQVLKMSETCPLCRRNLYFERLSPR
ncbi:hypothetical protein CFC21_010688 [Triticum aestivum]|uniref:RING-type domain-containing protein n=3 Tax=Triticinae TaxID=1648030 RepID=A0A9R1DL87_WHEAT|nr:uncharacterized protein LOC109774224 [Aegilops tauschii subsp. strangulata]XP_044439776.1 uncharacterized protein LOC123166076 [Triticum aestivum]KAF6993862.1 hypothetical protein CFC21_010688 [Triticum aestivum]